MSKRYYICPLVAETQSDDSNYIYAKIRDYADQIQGFVAVIPSDSVTGLPQFSWTLVCVEAADHSSILSDSEIIPLPDGDLDDAIMLTSDTQTYLESLMIDTAHAETLRDIIRVIGQKLEANFNEDYLSVNS